jgi:ATPase subunit of ABC transporter with duplicated ATPase domains
MPRGDWRKRHRENHVLKTVLGDVRELAGKIMWGAKTDIGYYSQQLEELDERNE